MEKKQEAEQEWKQKAYNASPLAGRHNYTIGIFYFKLALKAEIEKNINKFGDHEYDMSGHTAAYKKILSLIDEVKPIHK